MQLTRLAIDNSRVMVLIVLFITIYGVIVYLNYPSSEDPTIQIRVVKINAQAPALSPTQMENLVSRPLEDAVGNVDQVTDVTAAVRRGSTIITVTIGDEVENVTEAIQAIRNRVENTTPTLPQAVTNVTVQEDIGLVAIASIALWADGFSYDQMRSTALDIEARLMAFEEVRKITFYGIQDQQIFVDFDPVRVAELGVDPQVAANALISQNQPEPTGVAFVSGRRLVVVPTGAMQNADDVAAVLFQDPQSGDLISIGDIADVRTGYQDPPNQPVLFNGNPSIVLGISTHAGTNNVQFGAALSAAVDEIQYNLPIGMELGFATYQPDLIEDSIDEAMENVYETVGIVLAVVLVFLGMRAGLIVGSLVPISMLAGVILMSITGVEFQRMSITAVIIALGLLVDNGIVIAEDMRVRMERGATAKEAAVQSGGTLALPLLNSALTTSVAFLPIVLIAGSTGDYVRSLGLVVIMLVLSSWFLAMTVTPLFCVWFLKVKRKDSVQEDLQIEDYRGWLYTPYRHFIHSILGIFRIPFVLFIAGCLALSIWAINKLPTEFFPLGERSQYLVYLTLETQADIRTTYAAVSELTDWLSDSETNPEIVSNVAYIGSGGPRFFLSLTPLDPANNVAFVLVDIADGTQVPEMIARTNAYADANLPGINIDAKQMWMGATEPGVVEVRLVGPTGQTEQMYRVAEQLQDLFYEQPGAQSVSIDWGNPAIELRLVIDQARAQRQGVSTEDVTNALYTTLNGQQITSLRESEFEIPVVVQSGEATSEGLAAIASVEVWSSANNRFVHLDDIADISTMWEFPLINRRNLERAFTVQGRSTVIGSAELLATLQPSLDALDLPPGVRYEIDGEPYQQAQANQRLFANLPLALGIMALLVIGQFNSIRRGGIILMTIPLVLIGGVVGLVVLQAKFGFMAILGFVSLGGIILNHSIILIDRITILEADGRPKRDAIMLAALSRLRPILMTALATGLGIVPLILFGGPLFYGMASTIAFGVLLGTVLTLGLMPVLYSLIVPQQPKPKDEELPSPETQPDQSTA